MSLKKALGEATTPGAMKPGTAEAESVQCSHCGLPVPPSLVEEGRSEQFCCSGCDTVYHLLRGAGLEEYYGFRERLGESGRKVEEESFEGGGEFDSLAYRKLYCSELANGHSRTQFLLEGVHCAACVWLVERLPRLESGVSAARLDMGRALVEIEWSGEEVSLGRIAKTLAKMGYRPRPYRGQEAALMRREEQRALLVRLGVAGASAGNVMLMAFALYSGSVGFDEADTMAPGTRRFFELASLFVSLPALWAGSVFFRGAFAALRTRTPHMDLPIAIGILVGFSWGAYGALSGAGDIYFDSITALVFFLLIGRYLQRRHQLAAGDAAELFHAVVPGEARVLIDSSQQGESRLVATEEIVLGARVVVASGEVIAVDGIVESGHSSLDKSLLSGESRPIDVAPQDSVEAGALNLGSRLIVLAQKSGRETRVAQLMTEVEKALSTRTPLVAQADRLAGRFTITVLLLAAGVGIFWSFSSGAAGIQHALALLIVACPCALGLATPLALSSGVSQAARIRQLIFNPEALERLAKPGILVLDKTGTLTEGRLSVSRWMGDIEIGAAVLEASQGGAHPVARALCEYLQQEKEAGRSLALSESELLEISSSRQERLGRGVLARYRSEELVLGSPRFVLSLAEASVEIEQALCSVESGASPVLVALAGKVRALVWIEDRLRSDAAESLGLLHQRGFELHLLSGDHERSVHAVAEELTKTSGISQLFHSVRGAVTPEEKLARVAELSGTGRAVVMVGDGVNDAGALARADVGVAVKGAAEACRMSADVYLAEPGVGELQRLLAGAQRVLKTIRRGIAFSLAYNIVGISCAALGLLGPLWAAVLMPISSLTVVSNAYRSRMFQRDPPK